MTKLPFILMAIAIGGLLAVQPVLNAEVSRRTGSPFGAGLVSIAVSLIVVALLLVATRQPVGWGAVVSMPAYLWLAGALGVVFVVGALWLAPILGAALMFAAIVAGQMIVATLADTIGFSGVQSHGFDPWRIAGIVLVLAGVWAFQQAG